jgi:hypothetical protein
MKKTLRFEVFKRDNFRCVYCGRTPPEVILEVDHILPKSKNGSDDINNLVTSCSDCNRGKSNIPLNLIPNTLSENLKILKEKKKQISYYNRFLKNIEKRINKDIKDITKIYEIQYPNWTFSDRFKISLRTFLKKLTKQEIIDCLYCAISKFPQNKDEVIKYFCGICWNKIKNNGGR